MASSDFFFAVLMLIHGAASQFFDKKILGPADVVFNAFENCAVETEGSFIRIETHMFNRSTIVYLYNIHFRFEFDLDKTIGMKMEGSRWTDAGGWKSGALYADSPDVCEAAESLFGEIFLKVLEAIGVESCPIPAGEYKVENFVYEMKKFTTPQLYGKYNIKFSIMRLGEAAVCLRAYFEYVPKN